jgi:plastocyanin
VASDFVNPPIRMGADPACVARQEARPAYEFVVRAADGALANAFVRLKGSYPAVDSPPPVVRLEQRNCVYRPHVIGMRVGQTLEVVNADPTAHNVHALSDKGNAFNITQPRGAEPFRFTARAEELMLRVTCDTHAWMNIYVGVVSHPYFSVTGTDGMFELRTVPPGRHRIVVWHERFGPLEADVDLAAGQTATVDFRYTGHETPAAPE